MAAKLKSIKQQRTWVISQKPCGEGSPYRNFIERKHGSFEEDSEKREPYIANPDHLPEIEEQENEKLSYIRKHWREMGFTSRQAQVLQLVAKGLIQRDIAKQLNISQHRVSEIITAVQKKASAWYDNIPHGDI